MKKICLDFDDTLVNFIEPWLTWLKDEGYSETVFNKKDVTNYSWFFDRYGDSVKNFFLKNPIDCYNKLRLYPDSDKFYNWCKRHYNTEILTHASKEETKTAKTMFAKKWLEEDVNIRFFKELNEKYKYIGDAILIDDYPLHVINHIATNKQPGIIFNYQGGNGWSNVNNYKELINKLTPDMNLCYTAVSYVELIEILKDIR